MAVNPHAAYDSIFLHHTMTYSEKLKDPRWQKKRLEVLQEHNFTCSMCKDTETTLHVHHFCYPISRNPWDSASEDLTVYCECCHALETYLNKEKPDYFIAETVKHKGLDSSFLLSLVHDNENVFFMISEYKNGKLFLDTILTAQMFHKLDGIYSKWKSFIDKYGHG